MKQKNGFRYWTTGEEEKINLYLSKGHTVAETSRQVAEITGRTVDAVRLHIQIMRKTRAKMEADNA